MLGLTVLDHHSGWVNLALSIETILKCFCQREKDPRPFVLFCAIRKMGAVSPYDLVGMHLGTLSYFRPRYLERFFFLPLGGIPQLSMHARYCRHKSAPEGRTDLEARAHSLDRRPHLQTRDAH